ncbi:translation initiation factor IF-2 [Fistulifera solaris]|uniref:Translation initiation factor IF-2 n=1 Tax=Fistulifera solaris TaxID=1519565 RepID=A0A1Z5JYY4_FISSO|nr:translation initiation factor IF-2 [Fistulifera solaris]|eukprot:GAX19092.1 translation initiation factor IF-2 [Fistulifera solaris]
MIRQCLLSSRHPKAKANHRRILSKRPLAASSSNHNHNHNRHKDNSSDDNQRNTSNTITNDGDDNKQKEMNHIMKAFFQNRNTATNTSDKSSHRPFHHNNNRNHDNRNKQIQQQNWRSLLPKQQQNNQTPSLQKDATPPSLTQTTNSNNTNDSIRAFFQSTSARKTALSQPQQQPPHQPSSLSSSRGKFPWDLKPLQRPSTDATTPRTDFASVLNKYKTSPLNMEEQAESSASVTVTLPPNTTTTSLPRPPPRSGVGLAAPANPQPFTSPLSEMIRKMQLAQQQKQQQQQQESGNANTMNPLANEPRWRTSPLRALRHSSRLNNQQHSNNGHSSSVSKANDFLKAADSEQTRRRRPRKRQPIQVVLPSYNLSITETSLLFRQPKRHIERILRQLGVGQVTSLDRELLELVASECSHLQVVDQLQDKDHDSDEDEAIRMSWPVRPPVVTVMGHVDHGKTTLMDALRRRAPGNKMTTGSSKNNSSKSEKKKGKPANVGDIAGTEAGGITQVITAFQVALEGSDAAVTFLDTPGHAAFRNMRESGLEAADVIVLVVAAEDGLAAQSLEILRFYKSLLEQNVDISLVVAMNKIDQPGINLEECQYRLENQLLQEGLLIEGMPQTDGDCFGSPVPLYPISAKEGTGLDDLIEGLILQSEVMDLRSPTEEPANGILLDARIEKGLGVVVDAIVRSGSLKKGDVVVSGEHKGRVRMLQSTQGNTQVSEASASQPVRIMGFDSLPTAGDLFRVVESEEIAQEVIEKAAALKDTAENKSAVIAAVEIQGSGKDTLDKNWQSNLKEKYDIEEADSSIIRVPMVLKASADGTLMALQEALHSLMATSQYKLRLDIVQMAVGPVSENDMQLANESGAMVLGFDVKVPSLNETEVPVFQSKVIYTLLDSVRDAMAKRYLPPTMVEQIHGKADVQAVFSIGGVKTKVAGLRVLQGRLHRQKVNGVAIQYRVLGKDKTVKVASGKIISLKQFKQDVDEVGSGQECGLALEGYDQYEDGDIVECFSVSSKYEFS